MTYNPSDTANAVPPPFAQGRLYKKMGFTLCHSLCWGRLAFSICYNNSYFGDNYGIFIP